MDNTAINKWTTHSSICVAVSSYSHVSINQRLEELRYDLENHKKDRERESIPGEAEEEESDEEREGEERLLRPAKPN